MDTTEMIELLEQVINEIPKQTLNIIRENEQEIVDLNKDQLESGKDADNNDIFPPYTRTTIAIKRAKGDIFNRVTLLDTGAFYNGFKIKIYGEGKPFNIFSTDSKSSDLQDKYGSSIFGLIKPNEEYLNLNIIKPEIEKFIKKHIG